MNQSTEQILFVDDNEDCSQIFSIRIESLGYKSISANTGAKALELLATTQIDLVLCDIMMPEMDGIQLVREIRKMDGCQNLPIIMLTAIDEYKKLEQAFEAGANDYLEKFSEECIFKARIQNCLKLKHVQDKLINAEQQRVVLESMRAACHHIAQPMTGVMANLESLIIDLPENREEVQAKIRETLRWADRVCDLIAQMRNTRQYKTIPFMQGMEILDISQEKSGR